MNVKRVKFLIAGAVLLSAFLFLFLTSFKSENLAYFLTVDEIADKIADKNFGLPSATLVVSSKSAAAMICGNSSSEAAPISNVQGKLNDSANCFQRE